MEAFTGAPQSSQESSTTLNFHIVSCSSKQQQYRGPGRLHDLVSVAGGREREGMVSSVHHGDYGLSICIRPRASRPAGLVGLLSVWVVFTTHRWPCHGMHCIQRRTDYKAELDLQTMQTQRKWRKESTQRTQTTEQQKPGLRRLGRYPQNTFFG